ncbi:FAD-dependent oxidoreductase [Micromonospora sp. AP08]|uniref:FAD-dependent monooxygenase n=1 Tax=Micromonospora sp. AP08 TaxID=2604467 RepID=UPI0011D7E328|nr:FAD-dependent monooxygenase [Micromonospora sp. AP08]TYB39704.1 FAD-dependent oxidoreductase [Micromonospora sp. AP08]
MRIAIVGGGIGGLATAVCLERQGFDDIVLLEQAPEFKEIGAGIQVSNNGARLLRHLGLEDELRAWGVVSRGNYYYDIEDGELILETRAGEWGEKTYGAPFFHIHRHHLLDLLRRAVTRTQLRLGTTVTGVEQDGRVARLTTAAGDVIEADVVIGADGIRSTLRAQLFGKQDPEPSGYLCWRALIPRERLEGVDVPPSCTAWWGPDRSGVVFWVNGGTHMNFVGTVPSGEVRSEAWESRGDIDDLRRSYAGATEPLATIVNAIDTPFITGIFTRPLLEQWSVGRIGLLGDAAHPIWPFLANGATQAIEDAYVLSRCLARGSVDTVEESLREFQQRRWDRVAEVARVSREMATVYHLSDPEAITRRNEQMRERAKTDPYGLWLRGWLWGYDVVSAADAPLDRPVEIQAPTLV